MPAHRTKPALALGREDRRHLEAVARSRTEPHGRVQRAAILLAYAEGETVVGVARRLGQPVTTVDRTVNKALAVGARAALDDLKRPGRPRTITAEARAWIISLACQKPKDLGWAPELWTEAMLARYVREHAVVAGHPSAARVVKGTVHKLLAQQELHPQKVRYYLERRDPDFDRKMVQVYHVYHQVTLDLNTVDGRTVVRVSYDEKPGIQAIGVTAKDLPPVPGVRGKNTWQGDHEYVRLGTVSLLASIDLQTGKVMGIVRERHRSAEFIEFLQKLDAHYPPDAKIQVILDNHSAHTSKETRAYLATVPNRFDFVFTPVHASWLNTIEVFFAKLAKQMLRGIRVESKEELAERILTYLDQINADPVPFRWKHQLDDAHPSPPSQATAV